MVAKIEAVKSMRDVLLYNEGKVQKSDAKLLFASGFLWGRDNIGFDNKLEVFSKLTRQNTRSQKSAIHITLNFSARDNLNEGKMIKIANDYLSKISLDKQPYLVYQHFDAGHPHIHIATVCIADGGKRIDNYQCKGGRSFGASNELEIQYDLIRAKGEDNRLDYPFKLDRLERVEYGQVEVGHAISGIVGEVLNSYKCCSLPEFNILLSQFGVRVSRGRPGSRMYVGGGLLYRVLNKDNIEVGVPIKASNIKGRPILKNLEKRFAINRAICGPNKQRLRFWLDKALAVSEKSVTERLLGKNGIRVVFRTNPAGKIFGASIIDNAARAIFNNEDLGKNYGIDTILKAFKLNVDGIEIKDQFSNVETLPAGHPHDDLDYTLHNETTLVPGDFEEESRTVNYPASELPIIQVLMDRLYFDYEESENSSIATARKQMNRELKNKRTQLDLSL